MENDSGEPASLPEITDAILNWTRLRTEEAGTEEELWDGSQPGFGARVTGREVTFLFRYSFQGRERRLHLGRWPEEWTVPRARRKAAAAVQLLARGVDPEAEWAKKGAAELLRSFAAGANPTSLGLSEEPTPTLLELHCGEDAGLEAFIQWQEAVALLEQVAGAGRDMDSKQRRGVLESLEAAEKAILGALDFAVSSAPALLGALRELRTELDAASITVAPSDSPALRYGRAALALHVVVLARWPNAPYLKVADYIYGFLETEQAEKVLGARPTQGRGDDRNLQRNGLRKARTRALDQITSGKCPLEIFGAIIRGEHPLSAAWEVLIRQRRG